MTQVIWPLALKQNFRKGVTASVPVVGAVMTETGEVCEVQQAAFANPAASGDYELIPAPGAGKKLVILHIATAIVGTDPVTFFFKSGSAAISGSFATSYRDDCAHGLFECNENEAFKINLNSAVAVGISALRYIEVTV